MGYSQDNNSNATSAETSEATKLEPVQSDANKSEPKATNNIAKEVENAEVQTSPETKQELAADAKTGEKIQVTGSRIKRLDLEGPTPLIIIDKKEIDSSGVNSVSGLIKNLTQSLKGAETGAAPADGNTNFVGRSLIDLKGLGPANTLVLLNGQRFPKDPILGVADLNLIPISLVEKIEVLTGNATAVYGSDAVGGAINVITRSVDYHEASVTQSASKDGGGEVTDLNYIFGKSDENNNYTVAINYNKQQALYGKDRNYSNHFYVTASPYPNFQSLATGIWTMDSKCPSEFTMADPSKPSPIDGSAQNLCFYPFQREMTIVAPSTKLSLLATAEEELANDRTLHATIIWTEKQYSHQSSYPLTNSNPLVVDGSTMGIGDLGNIGVMHYAFKDAGLGSLQDTIRSYNINLGLEGSWAQKWDWSLNTYVAAAKNSQTYSGGFDVNTVYNEIRKGQLGRYNIFDDNRDRSFMHANQRDYNAKLVSSYTATDFVVSSEFGDLAGGPISSSFGLSYVDNKYRAESSASAKGLSDARLFDAEANRNSSAIFAEFLFPLTQEFELTSAFRADHYSDFGSTVNPNLAMAYRLPDMLFRASAGTGFRAPLLNEGYPSESNKNDIIFSDLERCPQAIAANDGSQAIFCQPSSVKLDIKDHEDLKPETSKTYNIGYVYSPSNVLSFKADYWNIEIDNRIQFINGILAMNMVANEVESEHVSITRNPTSGRIETINTAYINYGSLRKSGLDLALMLSRNFGSNSVTYQGSYSRPLKVENVLETKNGTVVEDVLGKSEGRNANPEFFFNNKITFGMNNQSIYLSSNTIGPYYHSFNIKRGDALTRYDLGYSYLGSWDGTISLTIKNITNNYENYDKDLASYTAIQAKNDGQVQHRYAADPVGTTAVLKITQRL